MNAIPEREWGQDAACCGAAAAPVTVSDTTEVRWFAVGSPPPPVVAWFTGAGSIAIAEERCDIYQVDRLPDVGVKWRHCSTLELKIRLSVGRRLALAGGLAGHTESWRKWSPADGLVAGIGPSDRRIEVEKVVVRRVLAPSGDAGSPGVAECHVEVTAIRAAGVDWWSFAFSAVGARRHYRQSIVAAWDTLSEANAAPRELVADLSICSGYPAWLSCLVAR